jgi:DNA-binding GntR family transcriptional regulator
MSALRDSAPTHSVSEATAIDYRLGPGTAVQHALEGLRRAILNGDLRPGQRVLQEDLAERLGVSIAPLREALAILEGEGQVSYRLRRGYFVTELRIKDLEEIYELRQVLEERAARRALPTLDEETMTRITIAARDCVAAATAGDVASELQANRRFHFAILDFPDQPHAMRLIRLLWDSTEAYRAMYYNSPTEREAAARAHDRIIGAIQDRDADRLVVELDAHRSRALQVLKRILADN